MNKGSFFDDCHCPLDVCSKGSLIIRGTEIKASYILERLATGTSVKQLVDEHEEITGEALALILLIASRLLDEISVVIGKSMDESVNN